MNFLKFLIVLFVCVGFSQDAFSHGSGESKNKCSIFANWKYKAKARVNSGVNYSTTTSKSCSNSYVSAYESNDCAWQYARNNNGSIYLQGAVTSTPWLCGRGFSNSELFYDLNHEDRNISVPAHEEARLDLGKIQFHEKNIIIPKIDGHMYANGKDVFSSLEIIVWKPEHDFVNNIEDTIATASKYLWHGKLELLNGEVTLTGDFPKDAYQVVTDCHGENPGYKVIFNKASITANLPQGIDGLNDEIIVKVISDGGTKERSTLASLEDKTKNDQSIEFNLFPNPAKDMINIDFTPEQGGQGSVKIYNALGNLISVIFEGEILATENKFNFNLSEKALPSGLYFVLIQMDNKQQYIEKIMYENK